jgi:hypothetical protein
VMEAERINKDGGWSGKVKNFITSTSNLTCVWLRLNSCWL